MSRGRGGNSELPRQPGDESPERQSGNFADRVGGPRQRPQPTQGEPENPQQDGRTEGTPPQKERPEFLVPVPPPKRGRETAPLKKELVELYTRKDRSLTAEELWAMWDHMHHIQDVLIPELQNDPAKDAPTKERELLELTREWNKCYFKDRQDKRETPDIYPVN